MSIVKHIPNTITSMNLICGLIGVVFAFRGRVDVAFPMMLAASVFDFSDGLCARLLDAYSDKGKELDSLCDMVSFGVLPSVLLHRLMIECSFSETVLCWVPLLIAVFSALRLAKFNVDTRQHMNFLGLPSPACAILCGALCYYVAQDPSSTLAQWCCGPCFVPIFSAVLCGLLVCELPMFSFKFSRNDTRDVISRRITFLVAALLCVVYVLLSSSNWSLVAVLVICSYIALNFCFYIFAK